MNYKNNYQRKQAVWREKWMKKVEERQKQKALINFPKAAYEAGESLREAFVNLSISVSDMVDLIRTTVNDIYETLSKPEVSEELKKLQGESKNI